MCNDDWNIDLRRWSEYVSSLEGTTLKKYLYYLFTNVIDPGLLQDSLFLQFKFVKFEEQGDLGRSWKDYLFSL